MWDLFRVKIKYENNVKNLIKINHKDTRKVWMLCSSLKTRECCSTVFIVNLQKNPSILLLPLLLNLSSPQIRKFFWVLYQLNILNIKGFKIRIKILLTIAKEWICGSWLVWIQEKWIKLTLISILFKTYCQIDKK